jgi:hypothetical protein
MNQLSGTKQVELPRARLPESFNRGVLTLISFLDSIDVSKFRPG